MYVVSERTSVTWPTTVYYDIVVVTETWLNSEVEPTFGKIHGYTHWARRDRHERAGGGVAVCFKEGVQAQHLDVDTLSQMEVMFFWVVLEDRSALLLTRLTAVPHRDLGRVDVGAPLQARHGGR